MLIKLLAAGGYVSVTYLQNRHATEDIGYILDPQIANQAKIAEKLHAAVRKVARSRGYALEWFDDKVAQFAVGATRLPLFQESVAQNVVLWRGTNLVIYAIKWEWSLARKLKRIGSSNRRGGAPLQREVARGWKALVYSPIEEACAGRGREAV